jgi:hypothetical protein
MKNDAVTSVSLGELCVGPVRRALPSANQRTPLMGWTAPATGIGLCQDDAVNNHQGKEPSTCKLPPLAST